MQLNNYKLKYLLNVSVKYLICINKYIYFEKSLKLKIVDQSKLDRCSLI